MLSRRGVVHANAHIARAGRASRRHLARLRCRCLNLDFGRSWRRSLRQARRGRIIAWNNDARERKRQRENRPVGQVAQSLCGARSHKRAALAAVGHRRLIRTAWHVGRHRHRRMVAHAFGHRSSGRHRRHRHRGQQQPRERERSKNKAEGGQASHLAAISHRRLPQNRIRHNSVTGRRAKNSTVRTEPADTAPIRRNKIRSNRPTWA